MDDKYKADSESHYDGPRIFRLLSLKTLKYLFFFLIGVFIIAEIALNVWIGTWIQQRLEEDGPTPKTIARMEKFWETTLDFDPAWLVDRKASEELIDAYQDALETWKRLHENDPSLHSKLNQWDKKTYTKQQWEEFSSAIEKLEPYIQDVLKLSQLIEREGQNCKSCFEIPNYNPSDYSSGIWDLYDMWRTLYQKAAALTNAGEYERACDLHFSTLPLSFCNPAKEISYYRTKTSHLKSVLTEIARLIPKIDNPKKYQSWLHLLNRYDPLLFAGIGNQVDQFALLNELYRSNRLGIKLDATPGKKVSYYVDFIAEQRYDAKMWRWARKSSIDDFLANKNTYPGERETNVVILAKPFVFSSSLDKFMKIRTTPYRMSRQIKEEENQAMVFFDALRLQIAGTLYELETGKKATASTDLVPNYFPEEILVRPSGKSFKWDENGKPIVPYVP